MSLDLQIIFTIIIFILFLASVITAWRAYIRYTSLLDEQRKKRQAQEEYLSTKARELAEKTVELTEKKEAIERETQALLEGRKERLKEVLLDYEVSNREKFALLVDRAAEQAHSRLIAIEGEVADARWTAQSIIDELYANVENAASLCASTLDACRQMELEQEEVAYKTLRLAPASIHDINLLVKDVAPRLNHPAAINRLIWTEYVQKPTTDLLSRIAPTDVSGIYKITHLPDKKSYIGKSTSVRRRLGEHIKSSLGIGSIADQAIHHAMRENGLDQYSFEVVEECSKEDLTDREKHYIDFFQTQTWGYNRMRG